MKVAFTICSTNYLSQAKTLGDSFLKRNPDYEFYIGLCDSLHKSVDYAFLDQFNLLPVEELNIEMFNKMVDNYSIIELNTSIKPFYFLHFFKTFQPELVLYLDPDIYIFDSMQSIEAEIKDKSCLLTPHIVSPLPLDGYLPNENEILKHGLYNLGFAAFTNSDESIKILEWWSERMQTQCLDDTTRGFFVDQLPMNLVPLFFKDVCISRNLGLNVANWNLNERVISKKGDSYIVNEQFPLVFFHFSNFNPTKPDELSAGRQTRFDMNKDKLLKSLFDFYADLLLKNNYVALKKVSCTYVLGRQAKLEQQQQEKLQAEKNVKKAARSIKKYLPATLLRLMKKIVEL